MFPNIYFFCNEIIKIFVTKLRQHTFTVFKKDLEKDGLMWTIIKPERVGNKKRV